MSEQKQKKVRAGAILRTAGEEPKPELVKLAKEAGIPAPTKQTVESLARNLEFAQYPKFRELPSGRSSSRRSFVLNSFVGSEGCTVDGLIEELQNRVPDLPKKAAAEEVKMYLRDLGHVYGYFVIEREDAPGVLKAVARKND